ncbi:MAG: hypothetical protein U1E36_01455 [Rickettsiales bacterium]
MSGGFLSPDNFPKLMLMSALVSLAIGMIIYNVTENMIVSVSVGIFLVVADYIGIKMLLGNDDK